MSNKAALGIITAATLSIIIALSVNTIIVKQAFAPTGTCRGCALAPGTESGTGGTIGGGHEPAKGFAPGQEATFPGDAHNYAPGIEKQTTPTT